LAQAFSRWLNVSTYGVLSVGFFQQKDFDLKRQAAAA